MSITSNYQFIYQNLDKIFLHIKISHDDTQIYVYTKTIYFGKYKKNTEFININFTNKKEAIKYIINLQQKYNYIENYIENYKMQIDNLITFINNCIEK
jgi:hypothetical protein